MKTFIVMVKKFVRGCSVIERHIVAARDEATAENIATNRFGGVVLNVVRS